MYNTLTHSGKLVDIQNISENDIDIGDIAHGLAKICRYNGSLDFNKHASVAQHCVLLSNYCLEHYNIDIARAALLHDAAEAYIGDMPSAAKKLCPDFQALDNKITDIIYNKYDVNLLKEEKEILSSVDKRIVLDETAILFPDHFYIFYAEMRGIQSLGLDIGFWSMRTAQHEYLQQFDYLFGEWGGYSLEEV